jgi:hypothetical protein
MSDVITLASACAGVDFTPYPLPAVATISRRGADHREKVYRFTAGRQHKRPEPAPPTPRRERTALLYRFFQLPMSRRRDLLGDYITPSSQPESDFERDSRALRAIKVAGEEASERFWLRVQNVVDA